MPQRQRELAFAEQALGDDRGERRRRGGDERVAEQDDARAACRSAPSSASASRAPARAALRAVLQPVPVGRHHRGLGDRKEPGRDEAGARARLQGVPSGMCVHGSGFTGLSSTSSTNLLPRYARNSEHRPDHDPAQRDASAPSVAPAAEEQRAERQPAEHREHVLVREREPACRRSPRKTACRSRASA